MASRGIETKTFLQRGFNEKVENIVSNLSYSDEVVKQRGTYYFQLDRESYERFEEYGLSSAVAESGHVIIRVPDPSVAEGMYDFIDMDELEIRHESTHSHLKAMFRSESELIEFLFRLLKYKEEYL